MKIAIIGRGNVGSTLGTGWSAKGHSVVYGTRSPSAPDERSVAQAVIGVEVVVLTVPSSALTVEFFGELELAGKVLIDCTNPVAPDFSGVDWGEDPSAGERAARLAPESRVVKAFNTVGFNVMADPVFGGQPASMLIAGDDHDAKAVVSELASDLGFAPEDAGPLLQSRWLEAFAWLWISMAAKYGHGREMAFTLHKR